MLFVLVINSVLLNLWCLDLVFRTLVVILSSFFFTLAVATIGVEPWLTPSGPGWTHRNYMIMCRLNGGECVCWQCAWPVGGNVCVCAILWCVCVCVSLCVSGWVRVRSFIVVVFLCDVVNAKVNSLQCLWILKNQFGVFQVSELFHPEWLDALSLVGWEKEEEEKKKKKKKKKKKNQTEWLLAF